MILEWGLILSVTSVSVTMLMIVGTFFAILPQAEEYYSVNRTWVLLLVNSFNIAYIIITPFIFNLFSKYYVKGVLISTVATGVAAAGRFLAAQNYSICLAMTAIVAVAHIPIITAPYGLLKLFPDWQKGYAASIPLFMPVLGINFCILYGMAYIASDKSFPKTVAEIHGEINQLNWIIAVVGIVSSISTIFLLFQLRDKIEAQETTKLDLEVKTSEEVGSVSTDMETNTLQNEKQQGKQTEKRSLKSIVSTLFAQRRTAIVVLAWGSIVGVNWTYGSLFGIIFANQDLTGKQIALIGLAANLSSALFSNLGTFLKNRFNLQNMAIIHYLNIFGILASIVIELSRFVNLFQNLYFLIFVIIVLRAGFSSFVSLAFIEMEKEGMSSLIVSGFFFWVANVVNLIGMELVDLVPTDFSLLMMTMAVAGCIWIVKKDAKVCLEI